MTYFVKWKDIKDGTSMRHGGEFNTAERAAEYVKSQVLQDFYNGLSGHYIYTIEKDCIYCPGSDFSCPYYGERGECTLENPAEECDDYMYYNNEEDDL